MKKLALLIILGLAGVITWYFWETKPKPNDETPQIKPLAVSQHSDSFNTSVKGALNDYYALTEAFVNWDSSSVTLHANKLKNSIEAVNFNEIKKDTPIYQTAISFIDGTKEQLATISKPGVNLSEKRVSFNQLSDNMYNLMRTIRYDESKIYLQECPMAFNDNEPGIWLSSKEDIRNPYLGLHHPKYKGGMVECGETKDTLDFMQHQ
ncbi:DUF3347 domain-containing protein [Chitinophagaceae bacterium LB-8]|uniref:DUF3347 domain-containing protein n=1 Tax=Paraflavisolibacter caeni TaxID=2982496 RepID=A0A9X2XPA9_9BACT|nr:DUF3347 domain-containing protein [Paraflavisolibacter caeni]MCU7550843.1 DUF3347 domain-containing protein [Paraflavisolibacter caeni]